MLKAQPSGLCRLVATSLISLFLVGCAQDSSSSGESVTDDTGEQVGGDDNSGLVGPYDGTYTVSFISNGIQAALGVLYIENNQFDGDLANVFSRSFHCEWIH